MKRKVILYPGEDGYVAADVMSLPGCFSQAKKREEMPPNTLEAIAPHLRFYENAARLSPMTGMGRSRRARQARCSRSIDGKLEGDRRHSDGTGDL